MTTRLRMPCSRDSTRGMHEPGRKRGDCSPFRRLRVSFMVMLITDMRHYLDAAGDLPELPAPALDLALHLGAIVGWVSRWPSEHIGPTNVPCRKRRKGRRCPGEILARLVSSTGTIEWTCPVCTDCGTITGWEATIWDKSIPS